MPSDEEVREDTAQWRRGVTVLDILYLNVFLCHKIFAFAFSVFLFGTGVMKRF